MARIVHGRWRHSRSASSMASPTPFSQEQKQHLLILWKAQARQLVDVKLSIELDEKYRIPEHAYAFAQRLHSFFAVFLRAESADRNPFLRAHKASALHPYLRLAYQCQQQDHASGSTSVQLKPGRHVVALHHENFLQELNQYETQANAPPAEFVRRDSFGAFLHHRPHEALPAIGCAMALAIVTLTPNVSGIAATLDSTQIIVRFAHLLPKVQMVDIKTGLVGKLLSLKGHVVKAQQKKLSAAAAEFTCSKCRSCQTHSFSQGRYSAPTKCIDATCRGRTFTMSRSSVHYVDKQEIRLQEAQEENTAQAGRTPRQLEVEFTNDLVDQCRPGDIVLVAAIVTAVNTAAGQRRAKESTTYKLFLTGHSVSTMSESHNKRDAKSSNEVTYTPKQLENIVQLCHADHRYFSMVERRAFPFDLLVRCVHHFLSDAAS
jgi:DNA replicative helicase MCM subunit Mcm2 (Cdc46/Mcm family)